MTIELSDDQFERLIGLMAEHRVAILTELNDFRQDLTRRVDDLKIGLGLAHTALGVIEEDIGKIQSAQRIHSQELEQVKELQAEHTQALLGVTELSKTNFDLIETLNKHIHGESSTISHDAAIRGLRPQ